MQKLEELNTRESIFLAQEGNLAAAEGIARRLQTPKSILRAYPVIISKCVTGKNSTCVTGLSLEAVKRLKRADDQSNLPRTLGEIAKSVAPADTTLAFEILDEMIKAANKNHTNTGSITTDSRIGGILQMESERAYEEFKGRRKLTAKSDLRQGFAQKVITSC